MIDAICPGCRDPFEESNPESWSARDLKRPDLCRSCAIEMDAGTMTEADLDLDR